MWGEAEGRQEGAIWLWEGRQRRGERQGGRKKEQNDCEEENGIEKGGTTDIRRNERETKSSDGEVERVKEEKINYGGKKKKKGKYVAMEKRRGGEKRWGERRMEYEKRGREAEVEKRPEGKKGGWSNEPPHQKPS